MALDYLATPLLAEGCDVTILDLDLLGAHCLRAVLDDFAPDLVGITNMSIQNDWANHLARLVKTLLPDTIVVKGGVHETFGYEYTLALHHSYVDACIIGEGEETIRELARAVGAGDFAARRSEIPGIAFWDGGRSVTPGMRGPGSGDALVPTRLTFDPAYNFDIFGGRKTAQVLATRGCESACLYCSESVLLDRRHERRRSIANVARELEELKQQGYEAVYFDDSTFTRNHDYVMDLCKVLREHEFVWGCNTRVDCLDERLVHVMAKAGCVYLFCGVETAVPEILRGMNKTHDPAAYLEHSRDAYCWLRSSGIPCSAFLIFGGPRLERNEGRITYKPESLSDVQQSLEFALFKLNPDYLSMNVLRFLPGLPLSFARQYSCIRPDGGLPVHAGHYDAVWYQLKGTPDLRSTHPIYRAFEGCASVNPPQMTPERCYSIFHLAVELVNRKNAGGKDVQTSIVVDGRFRKYLRESDEHGVRSYRLAPFEVMTEDVRFAPPEVAI